MPAGVDDFWQQHDGTMAKWGFPSYFVLAMQQAQRCQTPQDLNSRFWFHPEGTRVTVRPGIAVIHDLGIAVQAEITAARIAGTSTTLGNEAASEFAAAVTTHYEQLAAGYPAVGRIRPLLELVAVAHALESLTPGSTLKYWLTKYPVAEVRTPRVYELLTTCRGTSVRYGRGFGLELSGGIRLQALLQRLDEEGDVTAIRDLVVMSRPHDGALVWRIPLASWRIRGRHHSTAPAGPGDCLPPVADGAPIGCAVHERWYESPQP
jgi:hypothetical protein